MATESMRHSGKRQRLEIDQLIQGFYPGVADSQGGADHAASAGAFRYCERLALSHNPGNEESAVEFYGESLRAALDYGNEMEAATELQGMAMGLMDLGRDEDANAIYRQRGLDSERRILRRPIEKGVRWVGNEPWLWPSKQREGRIK